MTEWKFPADVRGWLTEEEGRALAEEARDRSVLEIGSYCGRSTICMAQTARKVTALDSFDSRGTKETGDTLEEFDANLERYGLSNKVERIKALSEKALPLIHEVFDFIFIDGSHDYLNVCRDASLAIEKLKPEGFLAFHDFRLKPGECDGGWDPGVTAAVMHLIEMGGTLVSRHGSVAIVRPTRAGDPPEDRPLSVFLASPTNGSTIDAVFPGQALCTLEGVRVNLRKLSTGTHALNYTTLWAEALDGRKAWSTTDWIMQHSDVAAPPGFVDHLCDLRRREDVDILSVVIPIKDKRGITSTAIGDWMGGVVKRLTMKEIFRLPLTFDIDDLIAAGLAEPRQRLLVNTGLWVCDFTKPWVEAPIFPGFQFRNSLLKMPDGTHQAAEIAEDWVFSHWANSMGLKIKATREVRIGHWDGGTEYRNDEPWGLWDTDLGDESWQVSQRANRKRLLETPTLSRAQSKVNPTPT
jgi:hypothetical protein